MANFGQVFSSLVTAIVVVFAIVALAMTRTPEVSAACGDAMWNMTLSALVVHALVMPFVLLCIVLPLFYVADAGVDASKAAYFGSLFAAFTVVACLFGTEVYYTSETLANARCVRALKDAAKVNDPLLTTATIIFAVYDGILIVLILVLLACTDCIWRALEDKKEEERDEYGEEGTQSILDVTIDR